MKWQYLLIAVFLILNGIKQWRTYLKTPNRNNQRWSKSNGDPVWGTISILLGVASLILQLIP